MAEKKEYPLEVVHQRMLGLGSDHENAVKDTGIKVPFRDVEHSAKLVLPVLPEHRVSYALGELFNLYKERIESVLKEGDMAPEDWAMRLRGELYEALKGEIDKITMKETPVPAEALEKLKNTFKDPAFPVINDEMKREVCDLLEITGDVELRRKFNPEHLHAAYDYAEAQPAFVIGISVFKPPADQPKTWACAWKFLKSQIKTEVAISMAISRWSTEQ